MSDLSGYGVVVTRPAHQAHRLISAIERAGGRAYRYPVLDIAALSKDDVRGQEVRFPDPDIVIFISGNAVIHGIEFVVGYGAPFAAVGPATRKAIEALGYRADFCPEQGFDSEALLEVKALQDVEGKTIRIVRGVGGRELLAKTLAERGAKVTYLEVYERKRHEFTEEERSRLQKQWADGEIDCITAMSIQSLEFLLEALPDSCRNSLATVSLVTPSNRVLQTALEAAPEMLGVLAEGPGTNDMIEALIRSRRQGSRTRK